MSFNTYSILWIVLFCFGFPSGVFGQYIQKETIGEKTYAVIYADGLAGAARWAPGVKMMRNGTTIRHQVSKGNGGNLSVNDRIPFRFIVAPEDIGDMFREAIGAIYNTKPMEEAGKTKRYWSSTEKGTDQAWFFDFTPGIPYCDTQAKSTVNGMARCVSDY